VLLYNILNHSKWRKNWERSAKVFGHRQAMWVMEGFTLPLTSMLEGNPHHHHHHHHPHSPNLVIMTTTMFQQTYILHSFSLTFPYHIQC
jgi:hypothetical protein